MEKRAVAIEMVVVIIIVIIGVAILLLFYSQISWTGEVDRQVCHQSVIYRATLPEFANSKDYVPLKCKTDKICITSGMFGSCEEFSGTKGVTKIKVRDEEDIEQVIAKEILSCWETMGEGKLSLFNDWFVETFGIGGVASSCVICSRVAFDNESLTKAGIDMGRVDVLDYMIRHKVPEREESYYVYLTGSRGKMNIDYSKRTQESVENVVEELGSEEASLAGSSSELSVLFMQVRSPKHWDSFKNSLAALGLGVGGSFVLAPVTTTKALSSVVLKSPLIAGTVFVAGVGLQQANVYSNREATAGFCGDISVGDESRDGCSVVRAVNYNEESLSNFCSKIESIP